VLLSWVPRVKAAVRYQEVDCDDACAEVVLLQVRGTDASVYSWHGRLLWLPCCSSTVCEVSLVVCAAVAGR
jgi:hypothetical protein